MANINLDDPNFAYVDNYFYTINRTSQLLLKKTFDGEIAFCYTLDIPVESNVVSLVYDGVHFWSLEPGSARVIIRKWKIVDLVCVQYAKFEIITTSSRTISGSAFAVEYYTTKLTNSLGEGPTLGLDLEIADGTRLRNDLRIYIGPNVLGQSEYKSVDSYTDTSVTIKDALAYSYDKDDLVRFYRSGYFFNDFDGISELSGSLIEIDLESGSVITTNPGSHFKDVKAAVFGQVKNRHGSGVYDFDDDDIIENEDAVLCLMYIKGPNMLFSDVTVSEKTLYGSMLLFGQTSETVYDLTLGRDTAAQPDPNTNGSTIYMLKSGYDYQVAQFDRMVNSISVNAAPAILPADTVSSSSINAKVLDQYDKPYQGKTVTFTQTGPGSLTSDHNITDQDGVATTGYIAGSTVGDATITATVQQT